MMRAIFASLVLAARLVAAHCELNDCSIFRALILCVADTFPDLIVNSTTTTDWEYVRITANHYSNGPVSKFCLFQHSH